MTRRVFANDRTQAQVIALEPESVWVAGCVLRAGTRVDRPVPRTNADGRQMTRIGALPFEVLSHTVHEVIGVSNAEIVDAMRLLFERYKVVVEPSGAASLAAVLAGKVKTDGRGIGLMLSGGDIALRPFLKLVASSGRQQ